MKIFDTHAHYFDRKFCDLGGGADSLLGSEEFRNKVSGIVNVGTSYDNCLICIEQSKRYDFMYAAVGIHPSDAQNPTLCPFSADEEINRLRGLIDDEAERRNNKIVAIGEIGLDYYWQPVDRPLQYRYFEEQMRLAGQYDLPVIIHNREAHGDIFDMICRFPDVRGVIHSCSMSAEMVSELVRRGWYISFSGTVTFKNASRVRAACAAVPIDRLLVETDAPYLAPVPHRGKLNNSILMENTLMTVADIHGIAFDHMAEITTNNSKNLFRI
jgi:TatD DNase family protein